MKKRYAIGIDPGLETGFVTYDRETKLIIQADTLPFWRVYGWFEAFKDTTDKYLVMIETPNSKRPIYARIDGNSDVGRVRENMSARIGANRREAELLAEGIERLGFEVKRVTPTRTKWTAKDLKQRTGITERTNQHVRDAIALVYGI